MRKAILAAALLALCCGCTNLNKDFVESMDALHQESKMLDEYDDMVDNAYRQDGVDANGNPKFVRWFSSDQTRTIRKGTSQKIRELIGGAKRLLDE